VPVGFEMHDEREVRTAAVKHLRAGHDALLERVPVLAKMSRKPDAWQRQLGTLGGGNHFIELCLDEADRVWVMLHSGSRGMATSP
jgi:tRNA-splicing ligase RtcB